MVRDLLILVMQGFLLFAPIALAQDVQSPGDEVIPVSAFFAEEAQEVFRLSPDGRHVAFLGTGGTTHLLVGDPRNLDRTSRTVTDAADGSVFSFLWLDDSRLAFMARLPDQKIRLGCALLENLPGGVIRKTTLATGDGEAQMAGIVRQGEKNLIVTSVPSAQHGGFTDGVAVDPSDGSRELLYENTDSLALWMIGGRNGETAAGVRSLPDGGKELVGIRAGAPRVLLACGPGDYLDLVGINPSGSIVHILTNQGGNFTRLEAVSMESGNRAIIGENPTADCDMPVYDRQMNRLLACQFSTARLEYDWKSPQLQAHFKRIQSRLPDGDIRFRDSSEDGNAWIVSLTTDTAPEAEYFYDIRDEILTRLDSRARRIPPERLGRMRAVEYPARDGHIIGGYLTMPPDSTEKNLPVVVFPHGGPAMRNYWGYDARTQFLTSRGYAVFQPNFRGSTGFGRAFRNAGDGQWGRGVMQDDVSDGVQWLIQRGIADPERIAILGGSYGGYAALAGLTFTPDLYACGVCLFGASDLERFIREIPEDWKPFYGDLTAKIGDPDHPGGQRRLAWQSPVHFTKQIRAPLMVYHGVHDPLIQKSQADRFVAACRTDGGNVDYLVSATGGHGFQAGAGPQPGGTRGNLVSATGGHGFQDPLDEQAVYVAIERFLAQHLGGKTQSRVPEEIESRLDKLRRQ